MNTQLALFGGSFYRCQACGQDVDQVQRVRGFRICDVCWARVVEPIRPGYSGPLDDALHAARERFWGWYGEMRHRYPPRQSASHMRNDAIAAGGGNYWPFCVECDEPVSEYRSTAAGESLFGGVRHLYCPRCEARHAVESVWKSHERLHPGWDDEEWLDLLNRSHPEAFEIGVLPGYWFELKLAAVQGNGE